MEISKAVAHQVAPGRNSSVLLARTRKTRRPRTQVVWGPLPEPPKKLPSQLANFGPETAPSVADLLKELPEMPPRPAYAPAPAPAAAPVVEAPAPTAP